MSSLMILLLAPVILALLVLSLPSKKQQFVDFIGLMGSLVPLGLLLFFKSDLERGGELRLSWASALSLEFYLQADPLSLIFLFLTAAVIPLTVAFFFGKVGEEAKFCYGLIFALEALLFAFFTARDLLLFVVFWEAMLFPLYFLILLFGKSERKKAATTFLIYMMGGSCLLIGALFWVYLSGIPLSAQPFSFDFLERHAFFFSQGKWIAVIFLLAFAVKAPLFPFHGWLPITYAQAPTGATILLSALLSKAAIYGLLRINLGFFSHFMQEWSFSLLILAIIGALYGGFMAFFEKDYKRIVAYSSFSHVNVILVGLFVFNAVAHRGALFQVLSHSAMIAGLFMCVGWLEERVKTRHLDEVKGAAAFLPHLYAFSMFFALASLALPGTSNFMGELLIFIGLFASHSWMTAVLACSIVLSVVYMLRMIQSLYFGEKEESPSIFGQDVHWREWILAVPCIFFIMGAGLYPKPLLQEISKALEWNFQAEKEVNKES